MAELRHLPTNLHERVARDYAQELDGVVGTGADFSKFAEDALSRVRIEQQWQIVCCSVPEIHPGAKILEIGSGFGEFVRYTRELGLRAYGIEPGAARVEIAREVLASSEAGVPLVLGYGEHLPFPDGCFDLVYSINVMEHVANPGMVLSEALRVLKRGGFLHFTIPNYGSWWEGHYGILWFPGIPLWLAKLYVRLLGRNPAYLDTLHFTDHTLLRRLLAAHLGKITILGWGQDIWKERVQTLAFSEWASLGTLKRMVRLVHRLGLTRLIVFLGERLHWETPMILTICKN